MDHKKFVDDQRWLVSDSGENAAELREDDDGDDNEEEETLSLSDLPLIHQWRKENKEDEDDSKNCNTTPKEEEFDFCSLSKESEMCAADEVFFQGQILPLRRHSVSSEKGSLLHHYDVGRYRSRSISRSDSMDHYYSSRSSSISSGQSSTSGSSSATASTARYIKPKLPPRNQFHSHPSPSPRLHFPSGRQGGGGAAAANHRNSIKKSSIWNVMRLGLVTGPPEIAFQDLKARSSTNSRSFGSRNSNSSSTSGGGEAAKGKKIGRRLLGGGCRCAADAVAPARVVIIKRSASENASNDAAVEGKSKGAMIKAASSSMKKKHLSHHRTFEWLKQLSVEGAADEA